MISFVVAHASSHGNSQNMNHMVCRGYYPISVLKNYFNPHPFYPILGSVILFFKGLEVDIPVKYFGKDNIIFFFNP